MLSRLEIGQLQVRWSGPAEEADAARARLVHVGERLLPAALDRALADLDDGGSLVILRRVEAHLPLLPGESDEDCAARWAQGMASAVRALVLQLAPGWRVGRSVESDAGIAFLDPLALLVELVADAVAGRLARWCWQPDAGALAAAQRALAALPGSDGASHAYASGDAPPSPLTPSGTVSWALACAGAALPALVSALHDDGVAPAALALLPAVAAERLATALGGVPLAIAADQAATGQASSLLARLAPLAARVDRWPAAPPADPRNVLLVLALAAAVQPSLRGAPDLPAAAVRALVERARQLAPELAHPTSRPSLARSERADGERAPRPVGSPDREAASPPVPAEPATPAARRAHVERAPTGFGGLLFLIPVLQDLAIPGAILDEPALAAEPGLGAVLYRLACVLAPDAWADRAPLWLAGLDEPAPPAGALDPERAAAARRAGQRVARAACERGVDEQPDDAPRLRAGRAALPGSLSAAPWFDELCLHFAVQLTGALRARLALELPAGALLDRVIRKTGTLVRTATHLRLELPVAAADVDLRRALLDLDPGWVPFLGRVVTFQYV